MTIENKELYNLYKAVKARGYSVNGYIEGFDGGITVYVTDDYAALKKTFYGDNKDVFIYHFDKWTLNTGFTDIKDFKCEPENTDLLIKMKALFNQERFNKITVDCKEFKKAVKGADAINKGDKTRNIVLSIHNGKFDVASWNELGSGIWQLEGDYAGNGAFMVSRKYLDVIKADTLEYSEVNGKIAVCLKGDVEAVIMPLDIDPSEFLEVLEYEYHAPVMEKTVIEQLRPEKSIQKRPLQTEKKPERKRARRLPKRIDIPACYWTSYSKNGKQTWRYGTGD